VTVPKTQRTTTLPGCRNDEWIEASGLLLGEV